MTTVLSPVSIASFTVAEPSRSTASHGRRCPFSSSMMSPGTSSDESTVARSTPVAGFRRTTLTGAEKRASFCVDSRFLRTSQKFRMVDADAVAKMNAEYG